MEYTQERAFHSCQHRRAGMREEAGIRSGWDCDADYKKLSKAEEGDYVCNCNETYVWYKWLTFSTFFSETGVTACYTRPPRHHSSN